MDVVVREREEVHTRGKGGKGIKGVASRGAKRFLCLCDQGEQLDWRGTKTKQLRRERFIVLVKIGTLQRLRRRPRATFRKAA